MVRSEVQRLTTEVRALVHLVEPMAEPKIAADAPQLERAIANLLQNAVRHATGRVEVSVRADATSVTIAAADDGPGVPVNQRHRVFEPFVRLDEHRSRPHGGAGLGLAIVRDLVADLGGSVTVNDGPLGGAVFEVRLPVVLSA